MMSGLEGRRIALSVLDDDAANPERAAVVRRALEQAGAKIDVLKPGEGSAEDWHGGRYAALVAIGGVAGAGPNADPRLVQLTREFLASEKPVAVIGGALEVIINAGGAAGRTLAASRQLKPALEAAGGKSADGPIHADGSLVSAAKTADIEAFAAEVVRQFAGHLEERAVDEMSEQSFPASDPPSTSPGSIGPAPERDSETRP